MKKSHIPFLLVLAVAPAIGGCKGGASQGSSSIDTPSVSSEIDSRHYVSSYAEDDHLFVGDYIPKDGDYHYRYCEHHGKYDGEEEHEFVKTAKSEISLDTSTLEINDVVFENRCSVCGYRYETTEKPSEDWEISSITQFKETISDFDISTIKEFKCSRSLYPSSVSCFRSEEGFYVDSNGHELIEMGETLQEAYQYVKGLDNFVVYELPSFGYLLENVDNNKVVRVHFDESYRVLEVRSFTNVDGDINYDHIYTFTYGEGKEIHTNQLESDYIENLFTYSVKNFSTNNASLVIQSVSDDHNKLVINSKYGINIVDNCKYFLRFDGDFVYYLSQDSYENIDEKSFDTMYETSEKSLIKDYLKNEFPLFNDINVSLINAKENSFLDNSVLYTKVDGVWVSISLDRNQLLNDISVFNGDKVIDVERVLNIEDLYDFSFSTYWVEPEKEINLSYDENAHWRYSIDHKYIFEYEEHTFNEEYVKFGPSFYGGNITPGTKVKECDICGYSHEEDLALSEIEINVESLLDFLSTQKDLELIECVECVQTYNDDTQETVSYEKGESGFSEMVNSLKASASLINNLDEEGYNIVITRICDDLGNVYDYYKVNASKNDVVLNYNINELGLFDYTSDCREGFVNAYYWDY